MVGLGARREASQKEWRRLPAGKRVAPPGQRGWRVGAGSACAGPACAQQAPCAHPTRPPLRGRLESAAPVSVLPACQAAGAACVVPTAMAKWLLSRTLPAVGARHALEHQAIIVDQGDKGNRHLQRL